MKAILFLCLLITGSAMAQACPDINIAAGTYSTALTEANSITSVTQTSLLVTMSPTTNIKFDSATFIQLNPGFTAIPTTGALNAQIYNGCGTGSPARLMPDTADAFSKESIDLQQPGAMIYPNPGTGVFYVQTRNIDSGTLTVYDLTGKVILEQSFTSETLPQFDLSKFAAQPFLVKINSAGFFTSKVIIKQ